MENTKRALESTNLSETEKRGLFSVLAKVASKVGSKVVLPLVADKVKDLFGKNL